MQFAKPAMIIAFTFLVVFTLFSQEAFSKNMYSTNGHNFTYDSTERFPIMWDLRQGYGLLEAYANYYCNDIDWAKDFYSNFLDAAKDAGINTILIRDEPRLATIYSSIEKLLYVANTPRALGLDVIIGGIINEEEYGSNTFNLAVIDILDDYQSNTIPGPGWGDWIGVHGFDEPDGQENTLLTSFAWISVEVANELGKPFGTFLGYPAEDVPELTVPYDGDVYGASDAITYSFWTKMTYGMVDWYPSQVWFDDIELGLPWEVEPEILGASDLIPSSGNYYSAYTTRDEVWAIARETTDDGKSTISVFSVYDVEGEGTIDDLEFTYNDSLHIRTPWPFITTSSSILSNDCGDRFGTNHDMSSAVVCWNPDGDLSDARTVFWDRADSEIIKDTFPSGIGAEYYSNALFEVGELDYLTDRVPSGLCTGVIGHSNLRILWVGEHNTSGRYAVALFGKNSSGDDISIKSDDPADMLLPTGFSPTGAVWGRFWTDNYPHRRSGFILYDNDGDYVTVYNNVNSANETWLVSNLYTNLFGSGNIGSSVTAYRDIGEVHFTPANDQIVAVVAPSSAPDDMSVLHGSCAWNLVNPGKINASALNESSMIGFSYVTPSDVKRVSFQTIGGSGTRVFFVNSGGNYKYSEFISGFDSSDDIEYANSSQWIFIDPIRSRHTKRAYADVLIQHSTAENTLSMKNGETCLASTSGASRAMMFDNMCRYATSPGEGAYDLEFQYGVAATTRQNAMIANVQSFGRAMQSSTRTFPGSEITGSVRNDLDYLTIAPIVHGARGLCFYSLGMALRSGCVGSSAQIGEIRIPAVLTSWGPSPDGPTDVNMVSRIHSTVASLTGNSNLNGPDFTDILIHSSKYPILDSSEAYNSSTSGGSSSPNYQGINFLAFEHFRTGDIYLIVSRDHTDNQAPWIVFPGLDPADYDDVICYGGWDPSKAESSRESSRLASSLLAPMLLTDMSYSFSSMPVYSASLLKIPKATADSGIESSDEHAIVLKCTQMGNGSASFAVANLDQNSEISVFSLAGRKVIEYNSSEVSSSFSFTLDSSILSPGVYFTVLSSPDREPETFKVVVF